MARGRRAPLFWAPPVREQPSDLADALGLTQCIGSVLGRHAEVLPCPSIWMEPQKLSLETWSHLSPPCTQG